jgi:hypothetical protein
MMGIPVEAPTYVLETIRLSMYYYKATTFYFADEEII